MLSTLAVFLLVQGAAPATGPLTVSDVDPGRRSVGPNVFSVTVSNASSDSVPALLSLRVEKPSQSNQTGRYRWVGPHDTVRWTVHYDVPERTYRILRAYVGVAASMPSAAQPYPWFAADYQTRTFALQTGSVPFGDATDFWGFADSPLDIPAGIRDAPAVATEQAEAARVQLRELLRWDRPSTKEFSPELISSDSLGPYWVRTFRILGEAAKPIEFQLLRRALFDGPLPTVIYLTGNPPGTKESGTAVGMMLADRGLQVALVDRRESARQSGRGELLQDLADPVYDARRLADFLVSRNDVAKGISVFGYSQGAFEALFLFVLHVEIDAAVLASRIVDHDSLFQSPAWAPTLYAPEIIERALPGGVPEDWDAMIAALTPAAGRRAAIAFRAEYPFFDHLNPAAVLPLAAPRPVLTIAGALDEQFPLGGVLAADAAVRRSYADWGAGRTTELHIMSRAGHVLTPLALDMAGAWLEFWTGANEGSGEF